MPQRLAWSIKHELWEQVEADTGYTLLCLECYLDWKEGRGEYRLDLQDFLFLGIWDDDGKRLVRDIPAEYVTRTRR